MNKLDERQERLDAIKFAAVATLSDSMINAGADVVVDYLRNVCEVHVWGSMLGTTAPTISRKYPLTWWDQFKEQHFPAWLKGKYPIKYRHEEIRPCAIYPELTRRVCGESPKIDFSVISWDD